MQARHGDWAAVEVECWPDPGLILKRGLAGLTETWTWPKQERSCGGHEGLGLRVVGRVGMLGAMTGICTLFPGLLALSQKCSARFLHQTFQSRCQS